ncbi:TVP38/TMEM64 family protein [Bianquea renquensis]|uniref:TVP38/TMEM64 family membrane protein n=1 Tax=Bianquea renquensis TaxID=2763661 RepID=A0A926DRV1_9FIRM|nr:TVP38/TMEM64 family protein [Bianquea renquensis]MBC8542878.1 TVP38/TMEM64 family protein [Bianquea renquensis]
MIQEDTQYLRRRRIVSILSFLIFLAFCGWLTYAVGRPLLHLASDPERFRDWVDSHGVGGQFILIGMQVLQVVVALIPGEVIEVGAGYAFGAVEGTLLCLSGVALGSTIIFLLTRLFGVRMVEAFISREKLYAFSFMKDEKKLNRLIFLVFFIPGTPKDLLTYCVGLTPMKLGTFLIISSIARVPSVVSSTFGGHALGHKNYGLAILVFIVTGAVSLMGMLLYNKIMQHRRKASEHARRRKEGSDSE